MRKVLLCTIDPIDPGMQRAETDQRDEREMWHGAMRWLKRGSCWLLNMIVARQSKRTPSSDHRLDSPHYAGSRSYSSSYGVWRWRMISIRREPLTSLRTCLLALLSSAHFPFSSSPLSRSSLPLRSGRLDRLSRLSGLSMSMSMSISISIPLPFSPPARR